jgi:hypothetical protein
VELNGTMRFPDHHRYSPDDLQAIDAADFVFEPPVIERVVALLP